MLLDHATINAGLQGNCDEACSCGLPALSSCWCCLSLVHEVPQDPPHRSVARCWSGQDLIQVADIWIPVREHQLLALLVHLCHCHILLSTLAQGHEIASFIPAILVHIWGCTSGYALRHWLPSMPGVKDPAICSST